MFSNQLRSLFLFFLVICSCGQPVFCQLSKSELSYDLYSEGYEIVEWSQVKDNIGLLLFDFITDNITGYYAYGLIDARGELLVGPDSVYSVMESFIPGTSTFNEDGTLFIYSNSGHGFLGPLYRIMYDPDRKATLTKIYPDIDIGTVMHVQNISGLGNVLWLVGRLRQPFHSIIVDKYDKGEMDIMSFERKEGYESIPGKLAIARLAENKLIVMGISSGGPGTDSIYCCRLHKYIIDLNEKSIISHESITEKEIALGHYPRYILPYDNSGRIVKARDKYFYLMPIESYNVEKSALLSTAFIEIDDEGDFVDDTEVTELIFEESSLKAPPTNFLLQHWPKKNRAKIHIWTVSLDQFPSIIIDKGE